MRKLNGKRKYFGDNFGRKTMAVIELVTNVGHHALSVIGMTGKLRLQCRLVLPYDKTLIAGRLGMQPESLSRAFARLKQIGVPHRAEHSHY